MLLLDQAGWHLSHKLQVPDIITIVPLPPKCPELNLLENVWQYLRDHWLSNRLFDGTDALLDHCCDAPSDIAIGLMGSDQGVLLLPRLERIRTI